MVAEGDWQHSLPEKKKLVPTQELGDKREGKAEGQGT